MHCPQFMYVRVFSGQFEPYFNLLFFRLYVKYITRPITSQPPRRAQLVQPRPAIMAAQTIIPSIETTGTNGTLNCLGISGLVTRNIHTPAHTSINAKSVPMLVISPTISPGTNAANPPTNTRNIQLEW